MKIKKIIISILITFIVALAFSIKSNAASVSISASTTSTTVGTPVTIKVNGNAASWDLSISGTGISTTAIVGYTDDAENGSFSKSVTFTPNSTGTYKISLTGNITDSKDIESTSVNKSVTVTVKAKSSSSSSNSSSSSSSNKTTSSAPSFTSVNETVYATASVNVRSSYSTSSSVIGSLEEGDSVTRIGKSSSWSKIEYNGQTAYVSSSYLTTEKPKESNEKNLESLTIEGDYELTPKFDKEVTEYSLTVGEDVEELKINAKAVDDSAKVEITGNAKLLVGENIIEIKVTAEDGTVRTYKINVTKGTPEKLAISELTVEGYDLSPAFSSDIYEYTLDIPDLSVTSLNIDAKSNIDNAIIETTGNEGLKQGENIITILVKSQDGKEVLTYQITANIHEPEKEQLIAGINDEDLFLYGGIAIGVIIILIIIIAIVKHRKQDDDFEPYYGGFDSLNKDNKNEEEEKFSENTKKSNSESEEKLQEEIDNEKNKKDRKSIIDENFGTDINVNTFYDEKPKRRKGKHF